MTIEELTERIRKITILLDDPHPGLVTWCLALGSQMNELCDKWAPPDEVKP